MAAIMILFPAGSIAAPGSSTANKNDPKEIYHDFCSVCHGDKGDGNSRAKGSFVRPPRDFTAPESKAIPRDYMITVVRDGKPGTAMVGWKTQLNEQQIAGVVDYIRTAFSGAAPAQAVPAPSAAGSAAGAHPATITPSDPSVAKAMEQPLPNGLKGNPDKGRTFYIANCATCHGEKGDGQGPRAYFINPKPRNFLHVSSRLTLSRPVLFNVISHGKLGTEMPAWNKVISDQEIADVAEFVFKAFIRPEAKEQAAAGAAK